MRWLEGRSEKGRALCGLVSACIRERRSAINAISLYIISPLAADVPFCEGTEVRLVECPSSPWGVGSFYPYANSASAAVQCGGTGERPAIQFIKPFATPARKPPEWLFAAENLSA